MRIYKHIILSFFFSFSIFSFSQSQQFLSYKQALFLAESNSLDAFLQKHNYYKSFWQYKKYKNSNYPTLNFNSQLASYSKSSNLRYNSITKVDEYVTTENINSNASLSLNQPIKLTGGSLYATSDLRRIRNYGNTAYVQYSASPFRVGYRQDVFGYNALKWMEKSAPLEFEKAKRDYIIALEGIHIRTSQLYFDVLLAERQLTMAEYNYQTIDSILAITQKQYQLGACTKDRLIDLKISKNNYHISLIDVQENYIQSKEKLLTFLELPANYELHLSPPKYLPKISLIPSDVMEKALLYNSESIERRLNLIASESAIAKAKANLKPQVNLNLSYGISNSDGSYNYVQGEADNGSIVNVYSGDMDELQSLSFGLSMPILNWNENKGDLLIAKSNAEYTKRMVDKGIRAFEHEAIQKSIQFNTQFEKVKYFSESDTLASESYQLMKSRFLMGELEVMHLINAQKTKEKASFSYIESLSEYWRQYYEIRQLTLYDFMTNKAIEVDFEELLKQF